MKGIFWLISEMNTGKIKFCFYGEIQLIQYNFFVAWYLNVVSEEPLQAYRAIKILKPSTHLSGNYTCVVSTFMEEDRQTRSMLVYSEFFLIIFRPIPIPMAVSVT